MNTASEYQNPKFWPFDEPQYFSFWYLNGLEIEYSVLVLVSGF
jgi:hypothetical protein